MGVVGGPPPYHYSCRCKLLDKLVASLALTPILTKELLYSLKVTLTPGLAQTYNYTAA